MKTITIQAPGSVMLMGEHAVLHGQPAMVTAVNRTIEVTLTPTHDQQLVIDSAYGRVAIAMDAVPSETWAQLLASLVHSFFSPLPDLYNGLHISIKSTFEGAMGLSSSTAVTAAIAYGLMLTRYPSDTADDLKQKTFDHVMRWMRDSDRPASGACLQSILYGGCRYYDAKHGQSEKIHFDQPFYLMYCGYKTPTPEVIEIISARFAQNEDLTAVLYETIGMSVAEAKEAIAQGDWEKFYKIVSIQQFLLHDLGVSDAHIDAMIHHAVSLPQTHAAKISGAGLGDCILVFGAFQASDWEDFEGATPVMVSIEQQGVQLC